MVTVNLIQNSANCRHNFQSLRVKRSNLVVSWLSRLMFALALMVSPASMAGGEPASVTGTVSYRERMALTPEAVVEVRLLDVSIADAAAKLIAEQTIRPQHQVPIAFELVYDSADIDERLTYAVRATIRDGGRLLFTTDRSYPVLTRGNPGHVDLVLKRISN